jgi:biotin transport system substrate-specific component
VDGPSGPSGSFNAETEDHPLTHAATETLAFTSSLKSASLPVRIAAVVIGSLFVAAAAQVEVPMIPVPMTMQTFAVLTVGLLYGSRLGAATVVAYLVWGAIGMPVFAGGANLAVLLAKPFTVGYLAGFVAAAFIAGAIAERGTGLVRSAAAVAAGSVAIYALGLPWLAVMLGGDLSKAVTVGAVPFLLGDVLKAALAVAVAAGVGRIPFGR